MEAPANAIQWLTSFYSAAAVLQFAVISFFANRTLNNNTFKKLNIMMPLVLAYVSIFVSFILSASLLRSLHIETMNQDPTYISDTIKCLANVNYWAFITSIILTLISSFIVISSRSLFTKRIASIAITALVITSIAGVSFAGVAAYTKRVSKIHFLGDVPASFRHLTSVAGYRVEDEASMSPMAVNINFDKENDECTSVKSYNSRSHLWLPVASIGMGDRCIYGEISSHDAVMIIEEAIKARDCDFVKVTFELENCTSGSSVYIGDNKYFVGKIDENGIMNKSVRACRGSSMYFIMKPRCDSHNEKIKIINNPHHVKRRDIRLSCK